MSFTQPNVSLTVDIAEVYMKANGFCVTCTGKIRTMCFIGTGVCCELCRKVRDGELGKPRESRTAG